MEPLSVYLLLRVPDPRPSLATEPHKATILFSVATTDYPHG